MNDSMTVMQMGGVGFFGMLLIGFLAGWIAEQVMDRDHGLWTNILVGIAGSFVGGTAASMLGFQWYGFIGNLVVATLGAIGILWFFGKNNKSPKKRDQKFDTSVVEGSAPEVDGGFKNEPQTPIYHTTNTKK